MSDNAFEKDYSDDSFWEKVKSYAKSAGEAALEPALKMYYAATDSDTPTWAKLPFMERWDISSHRSMSSRISLQS